MLQSEIQHAVISAATGGDNTLVAAVTGKRIRVMSLVAGSLSYVTVE